MKPIVVAVSALAALMLAGCHGPACAEWCTDMNSCPGTKYDCASVCKGWDPLAAHCESEWDSYSRCSSGHDCTEKASKCESALRSWEFCVNSWCLETPDDPACALATR